MQFDFRSVENAASNTLADCNALVSHFSNACDGKAVLDITTTISINISCTESFNSTTCPVTMSHCNC